jgi:hypothetical protein
MAADCAMYKCLSISWALSHFNLARLWSDEQAVMPVLLSITTIAESYSVVTC